MANTIKCTVVVVGDALVGKSALINRLIHNEFHEKYVPTSFDKLHTVQEVDKHRVEYVIWDTSGCPAYDSVRSLAYQDADAFLLCYKMTDPTTLFNIREKWIQELRKNRVDSPPVILCGCQADLRTDPATLAALGRMGQTPISPEQALAICCEIGAVNYVETSSLNNTNEEVSEAFEVCALAAMKYKFIEPPPPPRMKPQTAQPQAKSAKRKSMLILGSGAAQSSTDLATLSSKQSYNSTTSSVKKYAANTSFSGSETESMASLNHPEKSFSSLETRANDGRTAKAANTLSLSSNSSFNALNASALSTSPPARSMLSFATHPGVQQPCLAKRTESEDIILLQMPSQSPPVQAQLRSNGLSRRTSFRSPQHHAKPVAPPTSPQALVIDLKRQTVTVAAPPDKGFKTGGSTTSHGSTGSSSESDASGSMSKRRPFVHTSSDIAEEDANKSMLDPDVPDTEDPELLNQLKFVSPKSGVFRPVHPNAAAAAGSKKGTRLSKHSSCAMM